MNHFSDKKNRIKTLNGLNLLKFSDTEIKLCDASIPKKDPFKTLKSMYNNKSLGYMVCKKGFTNLLMSLSIKFIKHLILKFFFKNRQYLNSYKNG